jgi:hypothetical protein
LCGHSTQDILYEIQPGMPYGGWTKPQFEFWLARVKPVMARLEHLAGSMLSSAIASVLDKKANTAFRKAMMELSRDADG